MTAGSLSTSSSSVSASAFKPKRSRDLFGLNAEADTLEELVDKLPAVISDLLEPDDGKDTEIPVELVVHVSTRAQLNSDAA